MSQKSDDPSIAQNAGVTVPVPVAASPQRVLAVTYDEGIHAWTAGRASTVSLADALSYAVHELEDNRCDRVDVCTSSRSLRRVVHQSIDHTHPFPGVASYVIHHSSVGEGPARHVQITIDRTRPPRALADLPPDMMIAVLNRIQSKNVKCERCGASSDEGAEISISAHAPGQYCFACIEADDELWPHKWESAL